MTVMMVICLVCVYFLLVKCKKIYQNVDDGDTSSDIEEWGPPIPPSMNLTFRVNVNYLNIRTGYIGGIFAVGRDGERRNFPLYIINSRFPASNQEFLYRHRMRTGQLPYFLHHFAVSGIPDVLQEMLESYAFPPWKIMNPVPSIIPGVQLITCPVRPLQRERSLRHSIMINSYQYNPPSHPSLRIRQNSLIQLVSANFNENVNERLPQISRSFSVRGSRGFTPGNEYETLELEDLASSIPEHRTVWLNIPPYFVHEEVVIITEQYSSNRNWFERFLALFEEKLRLFYGRELSLETQEERMMLVWKVLQRYLSARRRQRD